PFGGSACLSAPSSDVPVESGTTRWARVGARRRIEVSDPRRAPMTQARDRDPDHAGAWPDLPFEAWGDTCATLHMWTQVVGKVRMAHAPSINHWWHVPLYVGARGLTTSPIPYG